MRFSINDYFIKNGNAYFSQMGFIYSDKWNEDSLSIVTNEDTVKFVYTGNEDEIQRDADIVYYLYDSKNITNMNLPVISSNGIYTVYRKTLSSMPK